MEEPLAKELDSAETTLHVRFLIESSHNNSSDLRLNLCGSCSGLRVLGQFLHCGLNTSPEEGRDVTGNVY